MLKPSFKKNNKYIFVSASLCSTSLLIPSYITYIYTEISGINYNLTSAALTFISAVTFIASFFTGIIIQRTHSKHGLYRPWFLFCNIIAQTALLMCFICLDGSTFSFVTITIGYLIYNLAYTISGTAQYGIYERMSQGDSVARDKISASYNSGMNLGYTLTSASFLTLVTLFGKGDEAKGFFLTMLPITVMFFFGTVLLYISSKNYDIRTGTIATGNLEKRITVKDTLSIVVKNKPLFALVIGNIFKYIGYSSFMYMRVYYCQYVLGDFNLMSMLLTAASLISIVASAAVPAIVNVCGGRKKTLCVCLISDVIAYSAMIFSGESIIAFFIVFMFAMFIESVILPLTVNCFIDVSEWWEDKTGIDTKAHTISISSITQRVAAVFSAPLLGIMLNICNYTEGVGITDVSGLNNLAFLTGFIPAITSLIMLVILLVMHKISDEEINGCIVRNSDRTKYGQELR